MRDRAGLRVRHACRAAQPGNGRLVAEAGRASRPQPARALICMAGKKLGRKIESSHAEEGEPLVYQLPAAS